MTDERKQTHESTGQTQTMENIIVPIAVIFALLRMGGVL